MAKRTYRWAFVVRRLTAMASAPASAEESVGPETSIVQQQLDQLQILKERLTTGGAEAIRRLSNAVSGAAEAVANAVTPPPYAVPRLEPGVADQPHAFSHLAALTPCAHVLPLLSPQLVSALHDATLCHAPLPP